MSISTQVEDHPGSARLRVASLKELRAAGCLVVKGPDRPIALFYDDGVVHAVDNRCPHMGFPLHKGLVQDGILICPWHHARFDLASGCTFDLFADDVPAYPVEVQEDDIYLLPAPQADLRSRSYRRLRTGMEQNVSLVMSKSVIGLLKEGASIPDIVREAALFGARNRDSWGSGLVILGAMAHVAPALPEDQTGFALSHGISAAARDCAGMAPRRDRYPLDREDMDLETARRWFRHWTLSRHRDGAERTLLTFLKTGATPAQVSEVIFSAITDRAYSDGGHTLDFANKAFEVADLVGWEHAPDLLPALVPVIVGARGAEESSPWRSPVDLIALLEDAWGRLPAAMAAGEGKHWDGEAALSVEILRDDPAAVLNALLDAVEHGARPVQLGRSLALAAATRLARFGVANEFSDWDTALHTFTYSNAMHQALKRCSSPEVLRGVFHGALSVYQDRFLNTPPAPLPSSSDNAGTRQADPRVLLDELLEVLNRQQQVGKAASLVSGYASNGHPIKPLLATLAYATIREDAAFHTFQMLEASLRQLREWASPDGRQGATNEPDARSMGAGATPQMVILVALARYVAAHAPTQRSFLQTFDIARRLHRGDTLYEE